MKNIQLGLWISAITSHLGEQWGVWKWAQSSKISRSQAKKKMSQALKKLNLYFPCCHLSSWRGHGNHNVTRKGMIICAEEQPWKWTLHYALCWVTGVPIHKEGMRPIVLRATWLRRQSENWTQVASYLKQGKYLKQRKVKTKSKTYWGKWIF